MNLYEQAAADIAQITGNANEWGDTLVFLAPNAETVTVIGLKTKHHTSMDGEGNMVNSRKAHVAFSEQNMIDANAGYPLRNTAGEVNLRGHKVTVTDSTGTAVQYMIDQWYPDETIGLIVCILGGVEV